MHRMEVYIYVTLRQARLRVRPLPPNFTAVNIMLARLNTFIPMTTEQ